MIIFLAIALSPIPFASAADKLIELIPADAFAALYVERPQRALPPKLLEPFFHAMTGDKTQAAAWVEAVKRIRGPALIGFLTPPPGQEDPDLFIIIELAGPPEEADELVEKSFLPVVEAALRNEGQEGLKFDKSQPARRILQTSGEPLFAYAVKEKLAFGSTRMPLSQRWLSGEWPKNRWVDQPGVRKLLGRLPREFSARVLFNPVPLLEKYPKPKPNSYDELTQKIFAPQDILAAAADVHWGAESLSIQLAAALAEECHGPFRNFARPATPARLLGVFPEDFVAVGRIGWNSPADLVAGAYAITDAFDPGISAEYREELEEFRKETGVDWDGGILGNLGEMAFGVRVDFTRKSPVGWVLAFPIADEARFREQFDKLVDHFKLEFDDVEKDGLLVRKARLGKADSVGEKTSSAGGLSAGGFWLAIDKGVLIVGGDREIVADVAKQAAAGDRTEPASPNLRACCKVLGDVHHAAVMLDIEQLRNKVPIMPIAAGPALGPLLMQGFAGGALTVQEGVVRLNLLWSLRSAGRTSQPAAASGPASPQAEDAFVALVRVLGESLAQARQQSRRVVSMANMSGIGKALYIYADGHKGAFPESLKALLRAMPDEVSLKQLVSPYDGKGPKSIDEVERKSYLVYRPGLTTADAQTRVLLGEREIHDGGACFLFLDGHVDFVLDPRASELLKEIAEGSPQGGQ